MRSKPSLKSLARCVLACSILYFTFFLAGCTSSTTPTFYKEDIDKAIETICKNEYTIDVKARLVEETLWVYIPVEDIFIPAPKPQKYTESFLIEENTPRFSDGLFKFDYKIRLGPDEEKIQEYTYDKKVQEKISNVWKVLRRVIFSMERSRKKDEPRFFYVITADIKNGFEIQELFYILDLKKVSYGFISWNEYRHRAIQDTTIEPELIKDDLKGTHLKYYNVTFEEFLTKQIAQRIRMKFQKPEVEKNADIDKEILKVAVTTLKTYGFKNFTELELHNLITHSRMILNQAAVFARPIEP